MPTEFADDKFKEILDSNKIQYAKAESMKCRKDGRSLKMFQLELKDPAEVKALISENLTGRQTGIIFKVEDFRAPILVRQCCNCQKFRTLGQKLSGQNEMCPFLEKATYTKDAHIKRKSNQRVLIVEDHMLLIILSNQQVLSSISSSVYTNRITDLCLTLQYIVCEKINSKKNNQTVLQSK